MHDLLPAAYGPQSWWLAQTPFEVILGAYLTQNTAWKAVELSLANLRRITERHRLVEPLPGHNRRGYELLVHLTRQVFATELTTGHAHFSNEFHALTVTVGKVHCGKTAHCDGCPIASDLRYVIPARAE